MTGNSVKTSFSTIEKQGYSTIVQVDTEISFTVLGDAIGLGTPEMLKAIHGISEKVNALISDEIATFLHGGSTELSHQSKRGHLTGQGE